MTEDSSVTAPPGAAEAQRALDDGDWHIARSILDALDSTELAEEQRAQVDDLRKIVGNDSVAIGIAATLGALLILIVISIYIV